MKEKPAKPANRVKPLIPVYPKEVMKAFKKWGRITQDESRGSRR